MFEKLEKLQASPRIPFLAFELLDSQNWGWLKYNGTDKILLKTKLRLEDISQQRVLRRI